MLISDQMLDRLPGSPSIHVSLSPLRHKGSRGSLLLSGRVITESDAMLKAIVEKRTSVNRFSVPFQC